MSIQSIPKEPHWAIITETSQYVAGDERSRTHPGHGYPDHYETTIQYTAYLDEDDWNARILRLAEHNDSFTAIKALPATVRKEVVVTMNSDS